MLLALWFDFWNPADWVTGPTPPPVVVTQPGAGGGHERAGHDYWEAREAMLRRHLPMRAPKSAPEPVRTFARENNKLVRQLRTVPDVPDMARLLEIGEKINQLSLQIGNIEVVSDDEDAILAILLC